MAAIDAWESSSADIWRLGGRGSVSLGSGEGEEMSAGGAAGDEAGDEAGGEADEAGGEADEAGGRGSVSLGPGEGEEMLAGGLRCSVVAGSMSIAMMCWRECVCFEGPTVM